LPFQGKYNGHRAACQVKQRDKVGKVTFHSSPPDAARFSKYLNAQRTAR
jgi:hypothetical protein